MSIKKCFIGGVVVALSACNSTPPAKDFSGSWVPLNTFPSETREIPLVVQFVYQASPVDVTLKSMLDRWAREAGIVLLYKHPSDFVLHTPVSGIHQPTLSAALADVNAIFAAQHVNARLYGNNLLLVTSTADNTGTPLSIDNQKSVVPARKDGSQDLPALPLPPPPLPSSLIQPELITPPKLPVSAADNCKDAAACPN